MAITPRTHPLKFLLYFEWVLLAIAAITELLLVRSGTPQVAGFNLILILGFGGMGLRLPTQAGQTKLIHLAISALLLIMGGFFSGIHMFPLMCIVFVMRCCLIFDSEFHLAIIGSTFLVSLIIQIHRFSSFIPPRFANLPGRLPPRLLEMVMARLWLLSISGVLLLGLVLAFLSPMITAVLSERKSREQLTIAHEQLQKYALQIEDIAKLQERNRIAREIHDSLGHALTASNLHLEAALRLFDRDAQEAKDLLREAKQLNTRALQEVRSSVSALRTDPLQEKSLPELIQSLTQEFERATHIRPRLDLSLAIDLPNAVKVAAYRVIQESLTNITKYAQASAVTISVKAQKHLELEIQDNGRGFIRAQTTSGFGLQGMQERVSALGGTLAIVTAPQQGCRIVARLPLLTQSPIASPNQRIHP